MVSVIEGWFPLYYYYYYYYCYYYYSDYKEYHTDTTVKFVVSLTASNMTEAVSTGIHKKFKLENGISTNNMVW